MLALTYRGAALAAGVLLLGCSSGDAGLAAGPAAAPSVVDISPAGGAADVAPTAVVVVSFDHPMLPAMPPTADLHQGDVTGPIVAGHWAWSDGGMHLSFVHDSAFAPGTRYTLHLGGGMRDSTGNVIDLDWACQHLDGQWAQGGMGGMMDGSDEMGPQWQDRHGTYGGVFTFTTR
jgi:hypothetical protein